MARFLNGLNEEISGFVEMFPYHNMQGPVNQAMRTERKIQQEGRGRPYGNRSLLAPWRRKQAGTSVVGRKSQGVATRPSPSFGAAKTTDSTASSPAIQQEQRRSAASTAAPSVATAAASSSHCRSIVCHKCQGRGHVVAQCPRRRTMIINEQGEWESESEPEEDAPRYDEELKHDEGVEIQPDEGDNNCFVSRRVLSVGAVKEENNQRHNLFHTRGMLNDKLCSIIVDNGSYNNITSQELVERMELKQRRHPSPYKIQWLNECGTLRVSNIVIVPFSRRYNDHVECDMVPMQACQLLLGRHGISQYRRWN